MRSRSEVDSLVAIEGLRQELTKLHTDLAVAVDSLAQTNKVMIQSMQSALSKQSMELMSSTYQLLNAKFSRVTSCTVDSIEPCKQTNDNDMNDPLDADGESDGT